MKLYTKIGLVVFIGAITACSVQKPKYSFDKVYYYNDFNQIWKTVNSSKSDFHFDKLLSKFLTDSSSLTKNESVAILYGALSHPGYSSGERLDLELTADSLCEIKDYRNAIKKANKCLEIFPLSAKAIAVNWYSYLKLEQEDSSDIYANRLSTIFEGMQASGYSGDKARPLIALSKNAIDEYCTKHAAGAGLKFEKEYLDEPRNKIVVYSSSFSREVFIIPEVN